MSKPAKYIADHVRRVLKDGGSAPHAAEVQWFFKEEIKSRGWYTHELRKVAGRVRRAVLKEEPLKYLIAVADNLFRGDVLEEKVFAVFLIQKSVEEFGAREFRLFESWLGRVSSWADHDALAYYLLGPMLRRQPALVGQVFCWANSRNRWRRRAAAVALIRGARERMFVPEIGRLTEQLLGDRDDMVQKGLGWLLRELAKFNRPAAFRLLAGIRDRAPRLVLRTACETLPAEMRAEILSPKPGVARRKSAGASA